MEAWGNFWQKGHSTTFGEYYADGYTNGYISDWWKEILDSHASDEIRILEVGCGNASLLPTTLDLGIKGNFSGVDAADVKLSSAVKKRLNENIAVSLTGNTKIEDYQPDNKFDVIASVYGVEYSDLSLSLQLIKNMLLPGGQVNFLMHHSGSVITEMSQKALGEFDFELMKSVIDNLEIINSELNKLHGKLPKLQKSKIAETARENVNTALGSIMNKPASSRNPILVDFSVATLGFFKIIQQSKSDRKDYLDSILPDFYSSKERFSQMVNVARDEQEIKTFEKNMVDAGFSEVIIESMDKDEKPVAWKITAS
jgi:ubiquinone/menaquinone biosynthesis C-methylase UbiE